MSPPPTDKSPHRPSEPALQVPELLAPAGNWECVRAAIENGADAVYFGLDKFNARMRADNFTVADLPPLMLHLHRRGVRGYVSFNTLVFTHELDEAREFLRTVIASGVDAAIVQDVGICRMIREISPDFPIHASTQMTLTSRAGLTFAREAGCTLAVLARECSLSEIESIQSEQARNASDTPPLPLEVFVHGALCVAYSGQCLTSEALGGRSANRGECAQACRMPYDLIADGKRVPLGDRRYLLSPRDLAGIELLPDLIRSGIASLKIEGRLKSPDYVASITRVYRQAIDSVWDRLVSQPETAGQAARQLRQETSYEMEMSFSRGLYTGWFGGVNNQELVHARFGKKRGVYLGRVTGISQNSVRIKLETNLKPGDGVVFDAGRPDQTEEGGRVFSIKPSGQEHLITFGRGSVTFSRIHKGDRLWKTSDPELEKQIRHTYSGDALRHRQPLNLVVSGGAGLPLEVTATDPQGNAATAVSEIPLVAAEKRPLDSEKLQASLGRLGGTPFRLGRLDCRLDGELMLPVSELNRLRRRLVDPLLERRAEKPQWTFNSPAAPDQDKSASATDQASLPSPRLTVMVRSLDQLRALLDLEIEVLYGDFENPKHGSEAVRLVRESNPRRTLFLAPPRIFKPGEDWILRQIRSAEPDGFLVRNYDHLIQFKGERCIGDYSLNVANPVTAGYYLDTQALEWVTASYDLNIGQLTDLLRAAPPQWFEITLHQRMPMFHMEHCLFCAFLSQGTDYTNCGRPCDRHEVRLRDRVGETHPVVADAGCRNTLYNSRAQTGAAHLHSLIELGARRFRLEFVDESPEAIRTTIRHYQDLLAHRISGSQLLRELRLKNQLGVTAGTLEK